MPSCAGFLKPRRSRLKPLKYSFSAENFICSLSWSICSEFDAIRSLNVSSSPKSPTQLNSTQLGFNKNDSRWLKKIYEHKSSNYTQLIEHNMTSYIIYKIRNSARTMLISVRFTSTYICLDARKQSTHCYKLCLYFLSYWYLGRTKQIKDRYLLILVRGNVQGHLLSLIHI